MADVELEVIDLATGLSVGKFPLTVCVPNTYELDMGSYRFRATYLMTGEVLISDISIAEGVNPPLEFTFAAPLPTSYNLTVQASMGGTTNPASGMYSYNAGTTAQVIAMPSSGYVFINWLLDGINVGTTNPYNLIMNAVHTLQAVFITAPPTSGIFGKTTIGATSGQFTGAKFAIRVQATEYGQIDSIMAYVTGNNWGANSPAAFVYSDNVGVPDRLLDVSSPTPIYGAAWCLFSFSTKILIEPSKYYWIGLVRNIDSLNPFYDAGVGLTATNADVLPPSDPFGVATYENNEYSIYANYTPVIGPLSITVSPTSASLQVGQSQSFDATVLGGVPPYTIRWINNISKTELGTGLSYVFNATAIGNYEIYAEATDNVGTIVNSSVIPISVIVPPLEVNVSPASASLQVGQSQTFNATVSGGTSPYSVRWIDNILKIELGTGLSYVFNAVAGGNYEIYAEAIDNGGTIVNSAVIFITVTLLKHTLTIDSTPIQGIPFTLEKVVM